MASSGTLPAVADLVHSGSLFRMNALLHRWRSAGGFLQTVGDTQRSALVSGLEQVPNLHEQFFLARRAGRSGGLPKAVDLLDNQKQAKGDYQKFHHRVDAGMKMLFTSDVTILPNAAPIMTPTARSIMFPLKANSLNSSNIDIVRLPSCVLSFEFPVAAATPLLRMNTRNRGLKIRILTVKAYSRSEVPPR
jgi:hypothetical protein